MELTELQRAIEAILFASGEKVEDCVRRAYRGNWDIMFMYEDPFTRSNAAATDAKSIPAFAARLPIFCARIAAGKQLGTSFTASA